MVRRWRARSAGGGEEALKLLSTNHFHVVLCDLKMPGMDGLALLARMRDEGISTTVIVMSAYGTGETALEAMKLGAYDYISKPFNTDEILLTIRKAQEREGFAHR